MNSIENDTITRIVHSEIEPIAKHSVDRGDRRDINFDETTIGKYEEQYVLTFRSSCAAEFLMIADARDAADVAELVREITIDPDTGAERDVDVVDEEEWELLKELQEA